MARPSAATRDIHFEKIPVRCVISGDLTGTEGPVLPTLCVTLGSASWGRGGCDTLFGPDGRLVLYYFFA